MYVRASSTATHKFSNFLLRSAADGGPLRGHGCGRTPFNRSMYMSTSKFKFKSTLIHTTRPTTSAPDRILGHNQKRANMFSFYMPESKRTSVRQSVHFCPAGMAIPARCFPIKEVSSPPRRQPPRPRPHLASPPTNLSAAPASDSGHIAR